MEHDHDRGWQAHPLVFPFLVPIYGVMIIATIVMMLPLAVWKVLKGDR